MPYNFATAEYQRQAVNAQTDLGTRVAESMLLNQYQNSPNLKEYMNAYIAEIDFLFEQAEEVYFGRFLEYAVGEQLDKIGRILNQERAVPLREVFFGFQGAPALVAGMADSATPLDGGVFLSEDVAGYTITPLNDEQYRRLLLAVGTVLTRTSSDVNLLHFCTQVLLGRSLTYMQLVNLNPRSVVYELASHEVSNADLSFIDYFIRKYLAPTGMTFSISRQETRVKTFFDGTGNYIEKDDTSNLIDFGADTAQGEIGYMSFKTKNLTADGNWRAILSSNEAAETEANLSYRIDSGNFELRIGAGTTETVSTLTFPATSVDLTQINYWKIDFDQTGWKVSVNGTELASQAVSLVGITMNATVIGVRYTDLVTPATRMVGSFWDFKHTGPRFDPTIELATLSLNEGSGSTVYSGGYNAGDWTINGTANWLLV